MIVEDAPRRWRLAIRLLEQTGMDVSEVGLGAVQTAPGASTGRGDNLHEAQAAFTRPLLRP
jgi:hypothetical protein